MTASVYQFNEASPAGLTEEILDLVRTPEREDHYKPAMPEVGDQINVFNGETVVQMTVESTTVNEVSASDLCGFNYLLEPFRWTESFGDVWKSKTSMRNKKTAGWGSKCCKKGEKLCLKKAA